MFNYDYEILTLGINSYRLILNQALNLINFNAGGELKMNKDEVADEDLLLKEQYKELKRQGLL